MGTPAISASGLPGSRVEAMRAGISRIGFMASSRASLGRDFSAKASYLTLPAHFMRRFAAMTGGDGRVIVAPYFAGPTCPA